MLPTLHFPSLSLAGFATLTVLAPFAASQEKMISRTLTVHAGSSDTVVTVHQYDRDGFLVRTIAEDSLVQEWDDQGRYLGSHKLGDTAYLEKTTWFSADSSQRRTPGLDNPLGERWFGRKKNCWCADSLYLYQDIHTLMAKMIFIFDTPGQVTRQEILYLRPDPDVLDTLILYQHTYDQNARLLTTQVTHLESGLPRDKTVTYEYADLPTLVVERSGVSIQLRRAPSPLTLRILPGFDLLGRSRTVARTGGVPIAFPRSH